jgi:hypothetical protein
MDGVGMSDTQDFFAWATQQRGAITTKGGAGSGRYPKGGGEGGGEPDYESEARMTPAEHESFLKDDRKKKIEDWNKKGSPGLPPGTGRNTVRERIQLAERAGYSLPRDSAKVMSLPYHQLIVESVGKKP